MTHEEMFEANMPLAVFAVRKYRRDYDEDDLQEAYIALWKAVRGYRGEIGAFSTYATRSIINKLAHKDMGARRQKRVVNIIADSLSNYEESARDPEKDIPCQGELEESAVVSEFWRRAKNELSAREYEMLRQKDAGLSLSEIGRLYGMTKQGVGQILHHRPRKLAKAVFGV